MNKILTDPAGSRKQAREKKKKCRVRDLSEAEARRLGLVPGQYGSPPEPDSFASVGVDVARSNPIRERRLHSFDHPPLSFGTRSAFKKHFRKSYPRISFSKRLSAPPPDSKERRQLRDAVRYPEGWGKLYPEGRGLLVKWIKARDEWCRRTQSMYLAETAAATRKHFSRINSERFREHKRLLEERRRRARGERELDNRGIWQLVFGLIDAGRSTHIGNAHLPMYASRLGYPYPETVQRFMEFLGLERRQTDLSSRKEFRKAMRNPEKRKELVSKRSPKPLLPGKVYYIRPERKKGKEGPLSGPASRERPPPNLKRVLEKHGLEPKTPEKGVRGLYPIDNAPYYIEGLWEAFREVWWPRHKDKESRGYDAWIRDPHHAPKNIKTRVQTRARRVVKDRGEKDDHHIPPAWIKAERKYLSRWRHEDNQRIARLHDQIREKERELERLYEERCAHGGKPEEWRKEEIERARAEAVRRGEPLRLELRQEAEDHPARMPLVGDPNMYPAKPTVSLDKTFYPRAEEDEGGNKLGRTSHPQEAEPDQTEELLSWVEREQALASLKEGKEGLTELEYAVIVLREMGLTTKEVAEALGIADGTVKSLKSRAMKKVGAIARKSGFGGDFWPD